MRNEYKKERLETPADNGQFGASGGVVSCDTSQDFGSSAPVQALPIPPPAPSCRLVVGNAGSAVRLGSEKIRLNKVESSVQLDKLEKNGELQKKYKKNK